MKRTIRTCACDVFCFLFEESIAWVLLLRFFGPLTESLQEDEELPFGEDKRDSFPLDSDSSLSSRSSPLGLYTTDEPDENSSKTGLEYISSSVPLLDDFEGNSLLGDDLCIVK